MNPGNVLRVAVAGHKVFHAIFLAVRFYPVIINGTYYIRKYIHSRNPLVYPPKHGFATNICQRLSRQSGRAVPGRNNRYHLHCLNQLLIHSLVLFYFYAFILVMQHYTRTAELLPPPEDSILSRRTSIPSSIFVRSISFNTPGTIYGITASSEQ